MSDETPVELPPPVEDESSSSKDPVIQTLDRMKPLAAQFGVGGIMGYCSGMALKKVGKAMATLCGLAFIALQSAAYAGYIQINWKQIGDDIVVKRIDSVRMFIIIIFSQYLPSFPPFTFVERPFE